MTQVFYHSPQVDEQYYDGALPPEDGYYWACLEFSSGEHDGWQIVEVTTYPISRDGGPVWVNRVVHVFGEPESLSSSEFVWGPKVEGEKPPELPDCEWCSGKDRVKDRDGLMLCAYHFNDRDIGAIARAYRDKREKVPMSRG